MWLFDVSRLFRPQARQKEVQSVYATPIVFAVGDEVVGTHSTLYGAGVIAEVDHENAEGGGIMNYRIGELWYSADELQKAPKGAVDSFSADR